MLYELYLNKAVGKKGTSILLPFSKDIFYSTVEILITIKLYISFKVKKTSFLTVRSHFSVGDVKNILKKNADGKWPLVSTNNDIRSFSWTISFLPWT